jgi:predicted ABC-type ATPase
MNPPTTGHKKLVDKIRELADKHDADHHIFLSHSQDSKKNPLTHEQKVGFARRLFPETNISDNQKVRTPLDALKHLHQKGYRNVTVVVGSDRVQDFHNLLHKYNGHPDHYNFDKINVVSAGNRDPDAEDVSGMSASKMRSHAKNGNFKGFESGVPEAGRKNGTAKEMYHAVRKSMGLNETYVTGMKAIFVVGGPGSGKDIVIKTSLDELNLKEINLDRLHKAITEKVNLSEMVGNPSIVVNGNAENKEKINLVRMVLETIGYDTAMVFVYTTNESSKSRNDHRVQGNLRTFSENRRETKYKNSIENMKLFSEEFNNFFLFDNSRNFSLCEENERKEIANWFVELRDSINNFLLGIR